MRLTILASGSGGNALAVESATTCVFIDAGLRPRRLRDRWQRVTAMPGVCGRPQASAVLLTHEHADHICGADDLAAAGLHLYATAGTAAAAALSARGRAQVRELAADTPFALGDFSILPVALSHDAAEPVAFVVSDGERRLGVITDCGQPSPALARAFADCDALVLETNYDRGMLLTGPYPERLKRRIASGQGHLSNQQSAELLTAILGESRRDPALVICAHLSKTNNRPHLAQAAIRAALGSRQTRVLIAEQDHPLAPLSLGPALQKPMQQLALSF